jgi:YfiH family protein
MSRRLEFDLGQGWAKGLRLVFATRDESAAIDVSSTWHVEQYHSAQVVDVGGRQPGAEPLARADGLIAYGDEFKNSRRTLLVKGADCAPILFVDRESRQVAAVHAGWRGLAQGIHREPFQRGFDPRTTWVWVGPCLNGESFEVGDDMRSRFPADKDDPKIFAPARAPEKRFFHAWRYMEREFERLKVEVFYNVEVDTFTDSEFASYRRSLREGVKLANHNYSWVGWGDPAPKA